MNPRGLRCNQDWWGVFKSFKWRGFSLKRSYPNCLRSRGTEVGNFPRKISFKFRRSLNQLSLRRNYLNFFIVKNKGFWVGAIFSAYNLTLSFRPFLSHSELLWQTFLAAVSFFRKVQCCWVLEAHLVPERTIQTKFVGSDKRILKGTLLRRKGKRKCQKTCA